MVASPAEESAVRLDPRVDRTREAALCAVRELLVEEGWDAVTQSQVAQRSGVGRTTVYRHWPERIDLVREAMDLELSHTRDVTLTGRLRDDLLIALEAIRYEMIEREGSKFLIAMVARSEWDPEVRELKKVLVERAIEALRRVLTTAVNDRRLAADVSVDVAVAQLVGPLVMRRLVTDEPLDQPLISGLVDDWLAARGARP
ncbi:MAG TPA: TetR/AcrR family transcriptional regulator [Pseudonocardia sp.]|jgi:AcrR family transcriptional regulator|nr:TetR/AcrR family transcriptional regulator [Pseudonocardia sp.]